MKIYTRTGDDGTTGLLFGGRVGKDHPIAVAVGDVDEAQATMGMARALFTPGSEMDVLLIGLERDLWVLMAELATDSANRGKLIEGQTLVSAAMVDRLEPIIDDLSTRFEPVRDFVVPGQTVAAAALDLARAVVRRAERAAVAVDVEGSHVVAYLNRLSDLLWTAARSQEGTTLITRQTETPTDAR